MFRIIGWLLLLGLIAIQFFHPKRNLSPGDQPNYIGKVFTIPQDVHAILTRACLDCHSNNTRYLWYFKIQPLDWWLTNHIIEGKKGLNLDEYTSRPLRYQYHKMEELIEMVKEDKMPLKSYKWTHKDARLAQEEKNKIIDWAGSVMKNLESKYPMDSLIRKK